MKIYVTKFTDNRGNTWFELKFSDASDRKTIATTSTLLDSCNKAVPRDFIINSIKKEFSRFFNNPGYLLKSPIKVLYNQESYMEVGIDWRVGYVQEITRKDRQLFFEAMCILTKQE